MVVLVCWWCAVIECSSLVDLLSCSGLGRCCSCCCVYCWGGAAGLREVLPYAVVGRRTLEPQGPRERPPPLCELETTRVGVQICPSARQPMTRVGDKISGSTDDLVPDRHDA
jgi:hypothetical protein